MITRLPKKRTVLILAALLLLVGITVIVWKVADWPPPGLILKYGFPPTGGPTGRTKVIEGIEFVELKPGYFRMGSHYRCDEGDLLGRISAMFGLSWGRPPKHTSVECPPHWVVISRPFWIARTEITNAQFMRFDPGHESLPFYLVGNDQVPKGWDSGPCCPVGWRSREDVGVFLSWLSKRSKLPMRLPSEAEWEYACRAGSRAEYAFGDDASLLIDYAWFEFDWDEGPRCVARKRPNAWGLSDFHGGMSEWCEDAWHSSYLGAPEDETPWMDDGVTSKGLQQFVLRGGHFRSDALNCRSSVRHGETGDSMGGSDCGFRPAFNIPEGR